MRPYSTNRASGLDWLVEAPEHWTLVELGRIGTFSKGGGGTKEDEVGDGVPCVRYGDLYTKHQFLIRDARARISQESAVRYVPLHYGDLLFAGSGETIEEIGKSAANLLTEPAYCGGDVILFRPAIEIDATFLGYAADCSHAVYQKSCMGRGVTVMHIYASELKHLQLHLPPLDEQRDIATFLERETERIDSLIAKKRLLIERLQEYRTALVTRTVTRGLPPKAARAAGLDPSSMDWGHAPLHALTDPLRPIIYGIVLPGPHVEAGVPIVKGGDVRDRVAAGFVSSNTSFELDAVHARSRLITGDLVFAIRGSVGDVAQVPTTLHGANMTQDTARISPRHSVCSKWLRYFLSSGAAAAQVQENTLGATISGINIRDLRRIKVPVPPETIQSEIARFLDAQTGRVDDLIVKCQMISARLQEYRTALITAAVTGKIDVRGEASVTADLAE